MLIVALQHAGVRQPRRGVRRCRPAFDLPQWDPMSMNAAANPSDTGRRPWQPPETVALADGTRVSLAFISPKDRGDLRRGFEGLSSRSRYLRFFSSMPTLPGFILDGLVNTDGHDHVAIGARLIDPAGRLQPEIVGVARYLRERPGASVAEPSVAVVDALHGRGLGSLLLRRLRRAARDHGIDHYRAHALVDNDPIRNMLRASKGRVVTNEGPVLVYDVDLQPLDPDERQPA